MSLTDLQTNSRKDLFEQLKLMSSKVEQLDYQKKVPIAYISDELFWGWASAYTDICNQPWFDEIYTAREHKILNRLDGDIKRIRSSLPSELPFIQEFMDTAEWIKLAELAERALIDLRAN